MKIVLIYERNYRLGANEYDKKKYEIYLQEAIMAGEVKSIFQGSRNVWEVLTALLRR